MKNLIFSLIARVRCEKKKEKSESGKFNKNVFKNEKKMFFQKWKNGLNKKWKTNSFKSKKWKTNSFKSKKWKKKF